MVNTFKFWFVLILVMIATLVGYIVYEASHPAQVAVVSEQPGTGVASIGGDFLLMDQDGNIRTNRDFHGKFMMVYFGYRYCPDICPTALTTMTEVLNSLGPKAKHIQPIFITIDPERDSAKDLKEYIQNFHESFIALTGNAEQIERAQKAYKVFAQKVAPEVGIDNYVMDHSSIIYVMDRQGQLVAHFNHSTPSEHIVSALRKYL
jgi:cytochrome oxidase Cu insertion factor (SCO1/SenC/PrrC family)